MKKKSKGKKPAPPKELQKMPFDEIMKRGVRLKPKKKKG